jgi:phosphoribosylformimino-5-aminoimidazole carboxamide ribotide isomerase
MIVIPAIDILDGRVARLQQGDFAKTRHYDVAPLDLARRYRDAGATWLHAVDLDGARAAKPVNVDLLKALADTGLQVQWGGGVRTAADLDVLFAAGAARVVVGSLAVTSPGEVGDWCNAHGGGRLCLALDLRQGTDGIWQPAVSAWRESRTIDVEGLLDQLSQYDLRHVLSTDIASDGMKSGPNLALYAWLTGRWPSFAWIASGGVRDSRDVAALAATGVRGCVAGTALLDGTLPPSALAAGGT